MTTRPRLRTATAAAAATLTALALPLTTATPAAATTTVINVTTTTDVIDPGDGLTSLREAIDQANTAGDAAEIVLAPGATYTLSICVGIDDDTNATGDLDLTSPYDITITGNGATITQACPSSLHLHWAPPSDTPLLTVTDATFTGTSDASSIFSKSSIVLDGVAITDNSGGSALVAYGDGSVTLIGSLIARTANGAGVEDESSGTLTITNSVITDNWTDSWSSSAGVHKAGGDAVVTNSTISENRVGEAPLPDAPVEDPNDLRDLEMSDFGGVAIEWGTLTLTDSIVEHNAGTKGGGIFALHAVVTRSTVTRNLARIGGGVQAGSLELTDSLVAGNSSFLAGGGLLTDNTQIERSTLTRNSSGAGGGLFLNEATATVRDTTISANAAGWGSGAYVDDATLTLESSTIAGNPILDALGPDPSNSGITLGHPHEGRSGHLVARSSVLDSADAGMPDCLAYNSSTVVSQGHNFDSDGTCGLTDPTDVSAGGDPLLGPLSDNGGTTETMLPEPLSPLLDRIPPGTPGCDATTAQNGVTRPQGPGCDIGAAERHLGGYHAVAPTRVLDSRDGTGGWTTPLGAGETRNLQLSGLPGDVEAVALNVTVTGATAASHLTTWPAGTPKPTASTLNWPAGQTLANAATVPVGAGNVISVFNNAGAVDVIVDVVGWYDNGELAGQSCPCGAALSVGNPFRSVDTRTGLGGLSGPLGPGQTASFDILPAFVTAPAAAVVNITAVQPSANTHLVAWAADATMPPTSNLNLPAGDVRANLAVVPVAPDGTIKVRNNDGDTHLLIDVYGWFGTSGARFRAVSPRRILDSRDGTGGWPGPLGPEQTATLPNSALPPGTALVGNLTAVFPTRATHLSVYPTGSTTNTSAINLPAGDVRANQLLVLSSPGITIRNNAGTTHTILDVTGYFG